MNYGFNFRSLYYLEIEELQEVVKAIRGEEEAHKVAVDKDVIIRGVIIPFFRRMGKAPKGADKDAVMRSALIRVTQNLGVKYDDWEQASVDEISHSVLRAFEQRLETQLSKLSEEDRQKVRYEAQKELAKGAAGLGVGLFGAGAVIAGEVSGFGIYLATTTGLKALSLALGTTFGWGVYQGATTLLGVVLGPVGWTLTAAGVIAGGVMMFKKLSQRDESKLMIAVIGLILALGRNPYAFFGLEWGSPMEQVKKVYRAIMKTVHPDVIRPVQEHLPPWLLSQFNNVILSTQEAYEKIKLLKEQEA